MIVQRGQPKSIIASPLYPASLFSFPLWGVCVLHFEACGQLTRSKRGCRHLRVGNSEQNFGVCTQNCDPENYQQLSHTQSPVFSLWQMALPVIKGKKTQSAKCNLILGVLQLILPIPKNVTVNIPMFVPEMSLLLRSKGGLSSTSFALERLEISLDLHSRCDCKTRNPNWERSIWTTSWVLPGSKLCPVRAAGELCWRRQHCLTHQERSYCNTIMRLNKPHALPSQYLVCE